MMKTGNNYKDALPLHIIGGVSAAASEPPDMDIMDKGVNDSGTSESAVTVQLVMGFVLNIYSQWCLP